MLKQAHAISEELIEWRRDLHMHPEIGFELHRTSKIVADELEKMGYRVKRGVGKTGVVAEIGEGGQMVAIRADMDALPILEQNEYEYVSQTPGAMHACGHDSHTAMALGAALLLSKEKLPGRVRFLFQPCEETTDEEGKSGAQRMSAEGAMDGVDYVIAQHVDPTSAVGTIGINAGPNSGGVDNWYATITGKGGHGAHPNATVDPYYLMSHVVHGRLGVVARHRLLQLAQHLALVLLVGHASCAHIKCCRYPHRRSIDSWRTWYGQIHGSTCTGRITSQSKSDR